MIQIGDIVECEEYTGLWVVTNIKRGKYFISSRYACLSYILDKNFQVPKKPHYIKCKVDFCHRVPASRLYDKIKDLNTIITKIKQDNDSN